MLVRSFRSVVTDKYDYRYVAFLHPDAASCSQHLSSIGYEVMVKDTPVKNGQISARLFRKLIQFGGCCGAKEFLKLYAYTLEDVDVVVHLDMDVIFLQPMDDLFEAIIGGTTDGGGVEEAKGLEKGRIPIIFDRPLPQKVDFLFTRDYAQMSKITTDRSKYGVQAGFFVLRANQTIFDEMIAIIRQGNYTAEH